MKNLRLVMHWFPLIPLLTAMGEAPRGVPRVMAALQVLRFLAAKTELRQDDELVRLLENILLTEQGRALIDYVSDEIHNLAVKVSNVDV
jgi:hypothetical protein